jgi:hypothetical protein
MRRGTYETLFLPVHIGYCHSCFGPILVAGHLGQMGDRRCCRNLSYYEHFLSDVLLSKPEKG